MTNRKWTFYPQSVLGTTGSTSYFPYSGNNEWQNALPDAIGRGKGTALLNVGSVEKRWTQRTIPYPASWIWKRGLCSA